MNGGSSQSWELPPGSLGAIHQHTSCLFYAALSQTNTTHVCLFQGQNDKKIREKNSHVEVKVRTIYLKNVPISYMGPHVMNGQLGNYHFEPLFLSIFFHSGFFILQILAHKQLFSVLDFFWNHLDKFKR